VISVGLDGAGKTTILYRLKLDKTVVTSPTVGFNVETVEFKNIRFTIWDCASHERYRPWWRHYLEEVDGLIFIIDSNDHDVDRIKESELYLHSLASDNRLKKAAVLVMANKQDLPNALTTDKLSDMLRMNSLPIRWV
jgi:ADP-ribosylation factor 1/2